MYTNEGQFSNNDKQKRKYMDMIKYANKHVDKDAKFSAGDVSLNIKPKDNDMFYAYNFAILNNTIKERSMRSISNTDRKPLEDNLTMLYNNIFSLTGYVDRLIDENNKYYCKFQNPMIDEYNPWIISKKNNIMESEFGDRFKSNSIIELLAKNMVWTNRATKEIDVIRRNIVESKSSDKNEKYKYGKKLERIVENILKDETIYEGQTLTTEFLDQYSSHIYDEEENIKNEDSYKKVEEIKDKVILDGIKIKDIDMDDVFKYLSVVTTQATMYQMKNKFIELTIKEIGELKRNKKLNGINVYKTVDENLGSSRYNEVLQISIPEYNTPFAVHCNDSFLDQLSEKYNVEFKDKDINNKNFSGCFYKYNEEQINQIKNLKRVNSYDERLINCIEYANARCENDSYHER